MPDLGKLEQEAKDHRQQVDEGLDKAEQLADKEAGGKDHGLIDRGVGAMENELNGDQGGSKDLPA